MWRNPNKDIADIRLVFRQSVGVILLLEGLRLISLLGQISNYILSMSRG